MKILHILDHSLPVHSGYSFRSAEILAAQENMGMFVTALTGPKHEQFSGQSLGGAETNYVRTTFGNSLMSKLPIVVQAEVVRVIANGIKALLRDEKYDVIHAHSPALNGIAALKAAKKHALPVVYEMRASWEDAAVDHGVTRSGSARYLASRALETFVLNRADAITTICCGLKDEIISRGVGEGMITVVPNAVDTQKFVCHKERRERLRRDFGVQGKFVIAFCGSFYSYEGLDMLLEALPALRNEEPEAMLLLAGGGDEESSLKLLAEKLGISNSVRFVGRVPQESVVDIYNLADVCAYPRRRMKLTDMVTPLKPLEAMATGAVVLASDVGGHKELIEEGVTGFFFEAGSTDSLLRALRRLSQTEDLGNISTAARKFVCSERTWQSSVARYTDVYEQAISNQDRTRN